MSGVVSDIGKETSRQVIRMLRDGVNKIQAQFF